MCVYVCGVHMHICTCVGTSMEVKGQGVELSLSFQYVGLEDGTQSSSFAASAHPVNHLAGAFLRCMRRPPVSPSFRRQPPRAVCLIGHNTSDGPTLTLYLLLE